MSYRTNRSRISSGDVVLWSGTGIAARIVRWFTKSKWSHVGIVVTWGNRLMVLDSFPFKGTRARPLSSDLKNAYLVKTGAILNHEAKNFALSQLGRPYSFQNLWKTWLGLDLVKRQYQCAQYVAEVMRLARINLETPATPESIARQLGAFAKIEALRA